MFIQAISQTDTKQYKTAFHAEPNFTKILNNAHFDKKFEELSKNPETKELVGVLTTLAGAAIAEITVFIQQNKELKNAINSIINELGLNTETKNNKVFDLEACLEEVPERNHYLKVTSYFPNLDSKYKELLKAQQQEPENKNNEQTLKIIENAFKYFTDEQRLMHMKPYLLTLDKYADYLDDIAKNILSTVENNQSLMYYMIPLKNGKLTPEDIKKWAKYDNLGCDDFLTSKDILNDTQISNLNNLKNENNNFNLAELKKTEYDNAEKQTFIFKLNLSKDLPVADKLKTIAQVHEALHGEITLKESKHFSDEYVLKDIRSELMDSLVKDHRLDSTYSFIKYIKPKALKKYNLSAKEIKFLDSQSQTYKNIKAICTHEAMNLDENNPKIQNIVKLLNDNEIYKNIITSRHAKYRFISRIVLKDNPNSDVIKDTKEKINILCETLDYDLDKCSYFCYVKSKRNAPQFYIKENRLGDYVKITLNHDGSIHTIFEDFAKEKKDKENKE